MNRTLSRVANGALAMIFFGLVTNVAIANAQTAVQTTDGPSGAPATSSKCGAGTLEPCGTEKIMKCEWEIHLEFNILTQSFMFVTKSTNCKESGTRPIYKDNVSSCPVKTTTTTVSKTGGIMEDDDSDWFSFDETCE